MAAGFTELAKQLLQRRAEVLGHAASMVMREATLAYEDGDLDRGKALLHAALKAGSEIADAVVEITTEVMQDPRLIREMALEGTATPLLHCPCGEKPTVTYGAYPTVVCRECYDGAPDGNRTCGAGRTSEEAIRKWNKTVKDADYASLEFRTLATTLKDSTPEDIEEAIAALLGGYK